MPLVTAIIPTYNRAAYLARALASVAAQDYRPIEAVVVDDGSTDTTTQILAEQKPLLADAGVALIAHRQPNSRAPAARNTAMELASGQLFAFLDSDDLWRPKFLSTAVGLLDRHPSAALAFCGIEGVDADDRVTRARPTRLPAQPVEGLLTRPFDLIMRYMPLQTSGVVIRRRVIDEIGEFDTDLPVVEDWDLWYRIARQHDFAYTQQILAGNRDHRDNLPKYSVMALTSGLKMNFKHLPEVNDPRTRQILVTRIGRQILLLQEELLRRGEPADAHAAFLAHPLAPRSFRYRAARIMGCGPRWAGRLYAGLIRWIGERKRDVAGRY